MSHILAAVNNGAIRARRTKEQLAMHTPSGSTVWYSTEGTYSVGAIWAEPFTVSLHGAAV